MGRSVPAALALLCVILTLAEAPVFGQTRELYPNTPDEVIIKRAAQQAPPLWQIPLGPALIEDMLLFDADRLLVGARKDFPGLPNLDYLMVDTDTGDVLWRYARDKLKGEYDCLLVLKDLLLLTVDNRKTASLVALDTRTGKEKWIVSVKGEQVVFIPLLTVGSVLIVNPTPTSVALTVLDLEGGRLIWEKSVAVANGAEFPQPLPIGNDIFFFYGALERVSAQNGARVFISPEVVFDRVSPPPQVEKHVLWTIASGNRLSAVDVDTGDIAWTAVLPDHVWPTNVYPLADKLYVRGIAGPNSHILWSIRTTDGQLLWTYSGSQPNVSNLIESGDLIYFGTPSALVALHARDGKEKFSVQVSTTGRTFPIRIRKTDDRIIYIGELIVAACDATTGKMHYRQGMTPNTEEHHLNGLDAAAPTLKEHLQQAFNHPGQGAAENMIGFASTEMSRYQNLASTYQAQAQSYYNRGDMIGRSISEMKQTFAQREAKFQATMAAALSITNLAMTMRQFMYAKSIQTFIERQALFRKSILSSYAQAETDAFVYRPHLVYRDAMDTFSTVALVHLPTGKRSETMLAPHYLSYGLWQVIDFEKGVVYHGTIGMDPARYELSESRAYYPYSKAKTVSTFLIAQPIKISQ